VKRVGIGGIWHETNTFAARRTGLDDFAAFELLDGDAVFERHAGTGTVIGGMLDVAGFEPMALATAGAWPGGRVTASTLTQLLTRLAVALRSVGPLDGVLLELHGAMVAEGEDDVERAVIEAVRQVTGKAPVVPVLDLHGNPSPMMVAGCDALVGYDTYPHVDMRARGEEAATIMTELLEGAAYRTLLRKVPRLISPLAQATDDEPMRGLESRARELEGETGIRRVSLFPGFPYSDVARAGFSVVVTVVEGSEPSGTAAASEIATDAGRHDWTVRRPGPGEAVAAAMSADTHPVVLADVADNIGGGSPGDGTALLAELLSQGAEGAVVTIADGEVAREASRRGVGSVIQAEVGGKTDRHHGDPVPIRGKVVGVTEGRYRTEGTWMTGREFSMGTTAVIAVDGVTLVVMERPAPPFHREHLTSQGIDPAAAKIIVAKGAIAWRSAYGPDAQMVIEVDTPGICPVDPNALERTVPPMAV
jgi:microcystin degradation protein MlrC